MNTNLELFRKAFRFKDLGDYEYSLTNLFVFWQWHW